MNRLAILVLVLVLPIVAKGEEKDAKTLAQETLDKGSALFDTRDASAIAATYTEDAQLLWTEKDNTTSEIRVVVKKGRTEIESFYRELFKDQTQQTTSRNTIEFARYVAPDLIIIEGVFQPNVAKPGKYPFVQTRVKQGDRWLMKTLQFFVISQD